MVALKTYWWRDSSGSFLNFGDELTPYLLKNLFCVETQLSDPSSADFFGVGSILSHIPTSLDVRGHGVIWGSGLIENSREGFDAQKFNVLALRGLLTYSRTRNLDSKPALGEPGLLISLIPSFKRLEKVYSVGFIPHYTDQALVEEIKALRPDIHYIDVLGTVEYVASEIAKCNYVISSSLHGLVLADALNVPNARIVSRNVVGGDFKFQDYESTLKNAHKGELRFEEVQKKIDRLENLIEGSYLPATNIAAIQISLFDSFQNWITLNASEPIKFSPLSPSAQI